MLPSFTVKSRISEHEKMNVKFPVTTNRKTTKGRSVPKKITHSPECIEVFQDAPNEDCEQCFQHKT